MRAETPVYSAVVGTAVAAARRRRYHYEADVADGQPRDYRLGVVRRGVVVRGLTCGTTPAASRS